MIPMRLVFISLGEIVQLFDELIDITAEENGVSFSLGISQFSFRYGRICLNKIPDFVLTFLWGVHVEESSDYIVYGLGLDWHVAGNGKCIFHK